MTDDIWPILKRLNGRFKRQEVYDLVLTQIPGTISKRQIDKYLRSMLSYKLAKRSDMIGFLEFGSPDASTTMSIDNLPAPLSNLNSKPS